jgi:hypothetical protein
VVFFFQCGDTDRYALSFDATGCNIPPSKHGWFLRGELADHEIPRDIEPALTHLAKHGYVILKCVDQRAAS